MQRLLAGALTGLVTLPLLTVLLTQLRGILNLPSQMLLYLLAVVVVALVGGLLPALTAAAAAGALLSYFFIEPFHFAIGNPNDLVALFAFLLVATSVSSVVGLAAHRTREAETLATANAASREELRVLAEEQAALRRVATLVARGVPPAEVFAAVADEVVQGRRCRRRAHRPPRSGRRDHRRRARRRPPLRARARKPLDSRNRPSSWRSLWRRAARPASTTTATSPVTTPTPRSGWESGRASQLRSSSTGVSGA